MGWGGAAVGVLAEACRMIQQRIPDIQAIDLNLGCPQRCALRGRITLLSPLNNS